MKNEDSWNNESCDLFQLYNSLENTKLIMWIVYGLKQQIIITAASWILGWIHFHMVVLSPFELCLFGVYPVISVFLKKFFDVPT